MRRPSICNALDTLLIHEAIAPRLLPTLADELHGANVELRCDPGAAALLANRPHVKAASESDYGTEFLDYIMAVKLVPDFEAALDHIAHYGSGHSEAIITENYTTGQRFINEVDAARRLLERLHAVHRRRPIRPRRRGGHQHAEAPRPRSDGAG